MRIAMLGIGSVIPGVDDGVAESAPTPRLAESKHRA